VRIILDTNVLISGIFFGGPPARILQAWRDRRVRIIVSASILKEYRRVAEEIAREAPGIDIDRILELITIESEMTAAPSLPSRVCDDPDDDKFLAAAIASGVHLIVSGDKALLRASGYAGVKVLRPRDFVDSYLAED
jgi:putative PIN family toxin of toxin-antitoxin system